MLYEIYYFIKGFGIKIDVKKPLTPSHYALVKGHEKCVNVKGQRREFKVSVTLKPFGCLSIG